MPSSFAPEIREGQGNSDRAPPTCGSISHAPEQGVSLVSGWLVDRRSISRKLEPDQRRRKQPDPSTPVNAAPSQAEPRPARLNWQPLPLEANPQVDFQAVLGNAEHLSAYAFQGVYSSEQQPVAILVNSNDPFRLWLNGKLIHEKTATAQLTGGSQLVPAVLQAGWNKLLIRVSHGTGAMALSLRLSR